MACIGSWYFKKKKQEYMDCNIPFGCMVFEIWLSVPFLKFGSWWQLVIKMDMSHDCIGWHLILTLVSTDWSIWTVQVKKSSGRPKERTLLDCHLRLLCDRTSKRIWWCVNKTALAPVILHIWHLGIDITFNSRLIKLYFTILFCIHGTIFFYLNILCILIIILLI